MALCPGILSPSPSSNRYFLFQINSAFHTNSFCTNSFLLEFQGFPFNPLPFYCLTVLRLFSLKYVGDVVQRFPVLFKAASVFIEMYFLYKLLCSLDSHSLKTTFGAKIGRFILTFYSVFKLCSHILVLH